ncbi:MAG: hypothetical protein HN642_05000, partial [Methylococcales bacterium]|nr:hypothetical protein [Methylococcales bacterium]
MPEITYLSEDESGRLVTTYTQPETVSFTDYLIEIKSGIHYQPHPALAKTGAYIYHGLTA